MHGVSSLLLLGVWVVLIELVRFAAKLLQFLDVTFQVSKGPHPVLIVPRKVVEALGLAGDLKR